MPVAKQLPALTVEQQARVEANLGLVHHYLARHGITPDVYEDRFQDGVLGLMRAVQLHNPDKGALSTLAQHWIRASIDRGRGRDEGINYRHAFVSNNPTGVYRAPISLNSMNRGQGWLDGDNDTSYEIADIDMALEAADDRLDAETEVAALGLTEDEIALLTWPLWESANWLGINRAAASTRRRTLRRRIAERVAA